MKHALDFFTPRNLFNFDDFGWFDNFTPKYFTNSPKINVKETDKAFEIEIANPGFNKDDTNIEVKDGMLTVSMKCETNEDNESGKYHCKQWSKSSYEESWYLPEDVIEDQITAKHADGVLTINLPKKEETPRTEDPRRIEIQ